MKKIFAMALTTLIMTNASYADKIKNYKEAVDLLSRGKRITMVIDFDKCHITNNTAGKLTGLSVLRMPNIVLIRNNEITGTEIIPTGVTRALPELGSVYQTSNFVFNKNNQFHAVTHVQDPITYTDKIPQTDIYCELGKGLTIYS